MLNYVQQKSRCCLAASYVNRKTTSLLWRTSNKASRRIEKKKQKLTKRPRRDAFYVLDCLKTRVCAHFLNPLLNGHIKVVLDFNFSSKNSRNFEQNLSNSVQFRLFLTPSRCHKPAFHRWAFEAFVQFFSFCPILLIPWRRKAEAQFVLYKMHFCLDFAKPP